MNKNYFNQLPFREKVEQLGMCYLIPKQDFEDGIAPLKNKKVVIIGCGAQGLHQGLNMRDSGLEVSYALRKSAIEEKRTSYQNAINNNFQVGTYEELIPTADLVCNLTPDKQHTSVVQAVMPLMKKGATLSYSHGFNIVEEGIKIREDITVIMVAPKSPGTEVREEYKRGFGVPTLIAVHKENDPEKKGLAQAKAYAYALGSHRAGVLKSSFVAEVKSDLMGEQTILCGVLQTASILCFDKMVENGTSPSQASYLIQKGWEVVTESLKQGGLTLLMNRLNNSAKIKATQIANEIKLILKPLYQKHMDDILSGTFSAEMMKDWDNNDALLLSRRNETKETGFEKATSGNEKFEEQAYYDRLTLMIAIIKAGVELSFEIMVSAGMKEESAYYESLHELPLIANLVARKKLFEMNRVISDTAEYGCYLFDYACRPLLSHYIKNSEKSLLGMAYPLAPETDNQTLQQVNQSIENHPIEVIGKKLRAYMTEMKRLNRK